ncbi:ABC transporter ATP-binding protein [Tropicimonas sp. IMCC34043]|uniref:ABC transporter ATP-binding protein n=1 Tax=Tropicimonas sp. IMCC34043 TaxID=2248760 RepID=UPI000E286084|nr:ABC transporter ATP-binding protein [Tropicimonas sp. IMCC34043]
MTADHHTPLLSVEALSVHYATDGGETCAVRDVSFRIEPGETVAIVGESGSGKSQSMIAAMGLLPHNGRATGRIAFRGDDLLRLNPQALRTLRGAEISMIFQEPMTSLDPLYRIGEQIMEPILRHRRVGRRAARARALEMLRQVHMPDPERQMRAYPHELSGGQRQRVMIAMALANNPSLLIADEPTTALDVTIQAEIIALIAELQRKNGMGVIFITHDLGLVRHIADRVYVMHRGEVVETGTVGAIFERPQHPYTRALLDAAPRGRKIPVAADAEPLLTARGLRVSFSTGRRRIEVLHGLDLTVRQGETLGIVGESGSGKSTLARAILRLVDAEGEISFEGQRLDGLSPRALRPFRSRIQVVFQDPFGALSPHMTAGQIVTEGLRVHRPAQSARDRDEQAVLALREVGLPPETRHRYIHEFSGGQRQRIAIARALILKPRLLILDEPTSALDRMVQKQVIDLLRDLQQRHGMSYVFVSHDLAAVRAVADRVLVMKDGTLVEEGPVDQVLSAPDAAYTRALIAAAFMDVA